MDFRQFLTRLILVTIGTAAALAGLIYLIPEARALDKFVIGTLGLFVVISLALYALGASAARSRNKLAFTSLISISVFAKMVIALGFLALYRKLAAPVGSWYVLLFLLAYVVYTGYEVWFMAKLGRIEASREK